MWRIRCSEGCIFPDRSMHESLLWGMIVSCYLQSNAFFLLLFDFNFCMLLSVACNWNGRCVHLKMICFICQYQILVTSLVLTGYKLENFLDRRAGVLVSTMKLTDSYLNIHYKSPGFFTMIYQFVRHGCLHSWNSVVYSVNMAMVGEHCRNSFQNYYYFFGVGGWWWEVKEVIIWGSTTHGDNMLPSWIDWTILLKPWSRMQELHCSIGDSFCHDVQVLTVLLLGQNGFCCGPQNSHLLAPIINTLQVVLGGEPHWVLQEGASEAKEVLSNFFVDYSFEEVLSKLCSLPTSPKWAFSDKGGKGVPLLDFFSSKEVVQWGCVGEKRIKVLSFLS